MKWRTMLAVTLTVFCASLACAADDAAFAPGDVLLREGERAFHLMDATGVLKTTFSPAGPAAWAGDSGLWMLRSEGERLAWRQYDAPTSCRDLPTDLPASTALKSVFAAGRLHAVYLQAAGDQRELRYAAFEPGRTVPEVAFALKDPDGKPEVWGKASAMHDILLLRPGELWLSGFPKASGNFTRYDIASGEAARPIRPELLGLFSMEELLEARDQARGLRQLTIYPAGNGRGMAPYDAGRFVSVCTMPPGRLTVVDPDRLEDGTRTHTLGGGIDPTTAGVAPWGFAAILARDHDLLVSHVHPAAGLKVYRVDRQTGRPLGVFSKGISVSEMIEVNP